MNPNIKTQANCQVQGYFKLTAVQGDDDGNPIPGTERLLCDWTPNLITDNGMELLKSSGFLGYIMVGSGSAVPAKTDTTLGAFVAGMAASFSQGPHDFTPVDYPWASAQTTCQFAKGVAAGNLSEIGVGKSQTNMFARALIKDTNGNPTTITVTSIELLTVTYQWRVYFDLTYSHTDTFTINSTTYTTTTLQPHLPIAAANNWATSGPWTGYPRVYAMSGTIGAAGVDPQTSVDFYVLGVATPGTSGNAYVDVSVHFDTSQANGTITGFWNIGASKTNDAAQQKCAVSPALVKDNTMELDITMRLAWSRKVP